MAQIVLPPATDLLVQGNVSCTSLNPPAGCVLDAAVGTGSGSGKQISALKLTHQHQKVYQNESATPAVSEARTVHIVFGAVATVADFRAGNVVANLGAATVTVDLLKNGASILTAPITLDSTKAAYSKTQGTLSSAALVAGDVLEVKTVATAGGGTLAKGIYAEVTIREDPT